MDNNQLTRMLREQIIPEPHSLELKGDNLYKLCNASAIRLNAPSDTRAEAARLLAKYWGITAATITSGECATSLPPEGYRLHVTASELLVEAQTVSGVRHAFRTLRMLAEPERGTGCLSGTWNIPEVKIEDAPALSFRGLHLCVFPENRFNDIAKKIRFAAYLKFNVVVIEFWGTFPFQSHPELCWSEFAGNREQWAELIREMREEEGMTLVPQFNVLGHAPNSRGGTSQHVVLNQHPEMEPLFEPDGWCWCLTNPNTIRLLDDAVCELHDFFGRPPYFHIGCDEADSIGLCSECRKHPVAELISNHIRHFRDLFAARGARVIMWHDMLLNRSDKRWENYTAMGHDYQHLEDMYKSIPSDVIIAAWEYGYNFNRIQGEVTYPTTMFFKENGFDTLACPWRRTDVIRSSAALAQKENLFGLLETTWHIFYGPEMKGMFTTTAKAAWGVVNGASFGQTTFDRAWRTVVKDMGLHDYNDLGVSDYQVIPKTYGSLG